MKAIFFLTLGLLATPQGGSVSGTPQTKAPAAAGQSGAPAGDIAVRAGKLYVGNGVVQEGVIILVKDGKILRIQKDTGTVPEGFTVVDARDRVVVPGLVCADTDLGSGEDDPYAVTPDVLAVDAFDFERPRQRELSGGVTTVYLSPSRNRLVSGQGSAVKLWGKDSAARVVSESVALRIALNDASRAGPGGRQSAPAVFEPVVTPSSDRPLLPARVQFPTARISQLAELKRVFAEAVTTPNGNALGYGPEEMHYEAETLRSVPQGKLPLRIAASSTSDIRRGVDFAKFMNAAAVIEDGVEAARVAALLAAAGIPVVLRVPVRPGATNPGDVIPGKDEPLPDPSAAGQLARSGVRVALAPSADGDPADLLLLAGVAVRYGMAPDAALAAVTLDAARVLGIDSRVGSLEPGKDADLALLTGEPFDGRSVVDRVYVDGREAFRREKSGTMLVVRAGRVLLGDGTEIRNGVVVIESGKIVSVASGSSIPFGAEVIDEPNGVVIPGLIDASSRLGLHAEGTANLQASSRVDVSAVVRPQDPVFDLALGAGVTTVLVNGDDTGLLSGRVSAIKTAGSDRDQIVLRKTAGLRFVHDGIGPQAAAALRAELNRGKGYVDRFKAHEAALKAFREGKGKKPEGPETKPADAGPDPLSGEWKGEVTAGPLPRPLEITLKLKLEGTAVTGTAALALGPQGGQESPVTGTLTGTTLELTATSRMGTMTLKAELAGEDLSGTFAMGPISGTITAKRAAGSGTPGATQAATSASGEPTEPQVDQALEPYRDLFAGKIPAVVRVSKRLAIEDVIKVFRDEFKLPLVLVGAEDLVKDPSLFESKDVGVQVGPELIERQKGKLVNIPARLSYAGVPVALQTENAAGSRWLPIHAVHAVRNGLDPEAALRSMSSATAKMYKLDDRIGTLARGKDGDLVLLSGDPFDLATQVRAVVVNGRIALDNRK